ncbi:MAG: hypothetical protein KF767_12250 [Bdellovibrionaceae bacterium]|nr:hypothetical protein [Pseudobdellovibrionaceae bacterium]
MTKRLVLLSFFVFSGALNARAMEPVDFQYYLISRTLFEFQQVKSVNDFVARYTTNWKEEDRAAFKKYSRSLKRWPEIQQDGTAARFKIGKDELRMDFREISRKVVYLGKVRIELNHHETFLKQIEKALAQPGAQESALYRAFVPEAHALAPFVAIPLAFVGVAIANKLVDRYGDRALDATEYGACYLGIEQASWEYMKTTKMCEKYIEAQKKVVAENPTVLAAKPALVDSKPGEAPIKTAGETCGEIGDVSKGKQEYKAFYQVLKEGLELRVSAQIDGTKLGKIEMYDAKTGKLVVRYNANADNTLSEILVPNPKRTGEATGEKEGGVVPAEISLPLVAKLDDPEQAALRTLYLRIYQHFGDRLTSCKAKTADRIAGEVKKREDKMREAGKPQDSRQ